MKKIKNKKYSILKFLSKGGIFVAFAFSFIFPFLIAHANGGLGVQTTINNPLGAGHLSTIPAFIKAVLNIVLTVGVPIVALAIIYAGFLFVSAQGNPEKLKTAKKTLLYTIIGAALLLGAYVLADAIKGTVDQIKSKA